MNKTILIGLVLMSFDLLQAGRGAISCVTIDGKHTLFFDRKETMEVIQEIGTFLTREEEGSGRIIDFYGLQNYITDEDVRELVPFLDGLPFLEVVSFVLNKISDDGLQKYLIDFLCKDSIQYVVLTQNCISQWNLPKVFSEIQKRTKTEEEDLKVLHKLIWVQQEHLGTEKEPMQSIPQDEVEAHRKFYVSDYACKLKKSPFPWLR